MSKIFKKKRQLLFNKVLSLVRTGDYKTAAFLRTSKTLLKILAATIVLINLIYIVVPNDDSIFYQAIIVVISILSSITDWYYDWKNLVVRFTSDSSDSDAKQITRKIMKIR